MKKKLIALFLILSAFSFSENVIRKVSVTGNYEKEVMPDVATITFQIKTKNQNLSVATKDANDRIEKFKSALKNMIMMITMTAKGKKLPFQILKVKSLTHIL